MIKNLAITTSLLLLSNNAFGQDITSQDVKKILGNYTSSYNTLAIHTCLNMPGKTSFTGSRLKSAFIHETNKVVKNINRGDHNMAAATARLYAQTFGHCYGTSKPNDLAQYTSGMGTFLAVDAIVSDNALKAKQAITLLDYAALNGYPDNQFIDQLSQYRDKKPSIASLVTIDKLPTVTVGKLSQVIKANKLRFKRDYEGKQFVIKGKLRGVDIRSGKISVFLSDYQGNPDNAGLLDDLVCSFSENGANADKAANLDTGDVVNLTGIVKYDDRKKLYVDECELR